MSAKKTAVTTNIQRARFTLIELMSIILLVGLVFIFVIPVHQAKVSQVRVLQAADTMQKIGAKAQAFRNDPNNGYYPEIDQLNMKNEIDTTYFNYSISTNDSTVVGRSKESYGHKDAYLIYNIVGKTFSVGKGDTDTVSRKYINENWLP